MIYPVTLESRVTYRGHLNSLTLSLRLQNCQIITFALRYCGGRFATIFSYRTCYYSMAKPFFHLSFPDDSYLINGGIV